MVGNLEQVESPTEHSGSREPLLSATLDVAREQQAPPFGFGDQHERAIVATGEIPEASLRDLETPTPGLETIAFGEPPDSSSQDAAELR